MTRAELITRLATKFGYLTHNDTVSAVKTILDSIAMQLGQHKRVEIRGFGSFSVNVRPPRLGRNPRAGAPVDIPAKHVPHFKPVLSCVPESVVNRAHGQHLGEFVFNIVRGASHAIQINKTRILPDS